MPGFRQKKKKDKLYACENIFLFCHYIGKDNMVVKIMW